MLQLCREHLGRHPCDKRRALSHYKKHFPAVDFSLVRGLGNSSKGFMPCWCLSCYALQQVHTGQKQAIHTLLQKCACKLLTHGGVTGLHAAVTSHYGQLTHLIHMRHELTMLTNGRA